MTSSRMHHSTSSNEHTRPDPDSAMYIRWMADQMWTFVPAQQVVSQFLATFREFPQRMPVASLSIDDALKMLSQNPQN